jgi:peptide deformylase
MNARPLSTAFRKQTRGAVPMTISDIIIRKRPEAAASMFSTTEMRVTMPVLEIITEGDPRLRQKAIKVRKVDDEVRRLAESLRDTIKVTPFAVGLAAPQVGILRRVVAIWMAHPEDDEDGDPIDLMLINPEIVRSSGHQVGLEGCLSIPGWVGEVERAMNVTVKARDVNDAEVRVKASGFLARALQHEIDHLDGVLFVDLVKDRSTLRYESDDDDDEALDAERAVTAS